MNKDQLHHLLAKHKIGQLNEEEKNALRAFVQTDKGHQLLTEIWDSSFEILELDGEPTDSDKVFEHIIQDPRVAYTGDQQSSPNRITMWKQYASIAAAILVIGFAAIYTIQQHSTLHMWDEESEVIPGSDKARIVFDDGTFVELNAQFQDTMIAEQGLRLFKKEDGSIAYEYAGVRTKNVYNTIITPRGGQHSLILPDGSQVWINADSKLRYPLAFIKDVRHVQLEGEAYFEVKKSFKDGIFQPFIVTTERQELEVLGTSFNINSYDSHIVTTLVEGSVSLAYAEITGKKYLKPSQQSNFSKENGNISIHAVDPYYTVAWKNGKFAFENASIYKVMRDIARWYDVDVQFVGDFSTVKYTGTISRFENFEQLLQLIEWTELVKFKKDGRRVTVMK